MKTITINSTKHGTHLVMVDDEDYDFVSTFTWRVNKTGKRFRAVTNIDRQAVTMHRLIFHFPEYSIDHIDGNPLNNQKTNLRRATHTQNMHNCSGHRDSKTGFKGVSFNNGKNKYEAKIMFMGKTFLLLRSKDIAECVMAYNNAAKKYFGEFAYLNKIQ